MTHTAYAAVAVHRLGETHRRPAELDLRARANRVPTGVDLDGAGLRFDRDEEATELDERIRCRGR